MSETGRSEAGTRFVTRHQLSGWRFVTRRIAAGLALHDTRMLSEPLRAQSRAQTGGLIVLAAGVVGCFLFSLLRPAGSASASDVLADRESAALYVKVDGRLHPVLNLASARLIVGRSVDPVQVRPSELGRYPRGNLLGIPGAPERMAQSGTKDADWSVCDTAVGRESGVTVITGAPQTNETGQTAGRMRELTGARAVLAAAESGAWLIWGGRRSRLDLADRAVVSALGLDIDSPQPRRVAANLINTIPEGPPLAAPFIPNAGDAPRFSVPNANGAGLIVNGAVVLSHAPDGQTQYYVVLPDGLEPITALLAAVLRNTDSHGLAQPPVLAAEQVAKTPVSHAVDLAAYPPAPIRVADPTQEPVLCARWTKPAGASTSSLTLSTGRALPVPDGVSPVDLVGSGRPGEASRIAIAPGYGYYVQVTGQEPRSTTRESLFWISDAGVRYGVEAPSAGGSADKTADLLGLRSPALPIPWSVLTLFAPGPALSRDDALLSHDSLTPDPHPGAPAPSPSSTRAPTPAGAPS